MSCSGLEGKLTGKLMHVEFEYHYTDSNIILTFYVYIGLGHFFSSEKPYTLHILLMELSKYIVIQSVLYILTFCFISGGLSIFPFDTNSKERIYFLIKLESLIMYTLLT